MKPEEIKNLGKSGPYSVARVKAFDTPDGGGYNCDLLRDGKVIAHVFEAGRGGYPDFHFGSRAEQERFEAYAKSLPPVPCKIEGLDDKPLEMDDELLIAELVQGFETRAWLKRQSKKKIVFKKPEDREDTWSIISLQGHAFSPEIAEVIRKKYGQDIIIANELLA